MDKNKYPHRDHRQRVRDEFRKTGCENMPDTAILELLLFYAIPRKDTKPIAEKLIEKYGSLKGIACADPRELEAFEGMGESSSLLLSLLPEIAARAGGAKKAPDCLISPGEIAAKIYGELKGCDKEVLYAACINAVGMMTAGRILCEGGADAVTADKRSILEFAFDEDADSVIIAHNHPGAEAAPSASDIDLTKETARLLAETGIKLADHIIVGTDGFLSLASTEKFAKLFE